MDFKKPIILCYTKKEIDEYVFASASCVNALCLQGSSYTCNSGTNYVCARDTYSTNNCPPGNTFSCGTTVNHTDSIIDWDL